MKIIYHDRTGRHLSVISAAIHLNLVEEDISRWNLKQLPNFMHNKSQGKLVYMGLDFQGNEIYVMGRKKTFQVIRNAYLGLNRAFSLNQDFIFIDVQPLSNIFLKIFDFANRKSGNNIKQTELLFRGLEKATPDLKKIVREIRLKKLGVK